MNRLIFACCICVCLLVPIILVGIFFIYDVVNSDSKQIQESHNIENNKTIQETQHMSYFPLLLSNRLQQGNFENGRKLFRQCAICHASERDGANRIGPPLWGVVDRPFAVMKGFTYSKALRENFDKKWDFVTLDRYLQSPRKEIPGTTMSFRGVKNDQDRADLLLYLRSLSDHPVPLLGHENGEQN
ncbi:c-type cytochrome [Bartonella bacilliformis]|uniref:Cytochrome c domain-containing protein n=1 Tax=Bartonella bacilliformis Ver097 TaxID=1293911 RepID=A0A072R5C4_BARBA|nr:cytochrome c family protein [Bartonella bacilliformis]KEG21133.1 hypothetical protein H710_00080 [Bartonella bacilliformis Ver097]